MTVLTLDGEAREVGALVTAAGHRVARVVFQSRNRPDPVTFLGRGKLDEVREFVQAGRDPPVSGEAPLVVVDAEVKPPVLFNLEATLHCEVWDRIRLILEIFQQHAQVKEARLQVELARLRYELPYVHEALHRRLKGERPGYMGGGELEIRTYETHLKRRTKLILKELERVKKERRTRRAGRRRSGLRLVAITGYTNGGKSSLLNALTDSEVQADVRFFTTIQTATRRLRPGLVGHAPTDILFTDTVGFIQNLPPWLIDAFASTLEEVTYADAVLLVVDAGEPPHVAEGKIRTVLRVLDRIHAPRRVVCVLNKIDLLAPDSHKPLQNDLILRVLPPEVRVVLASARTGTGIAQLVDLLVHDVLESREASVRLDLARPPHLQFAHWLHERTEILDTREEEGIRTLRIRCASESWGKLLSEARRANAHVSSAPSTRN